MSAFVGIDVSKATLDVVVLVEQKQSYCQVPNTTPGITDLLKWLDTFEQVETVCLEATGRYGSRLAKMLYADGFRVSVLNPLRIKSFAQSLLSRNKTDKYDAFVIALYAQRMVPDPWTPPSNTLERLKERTRLLHSLKQTQQAYRNRLQSGLEDEITLGVIRDLIADLDERIIALRKSLISLIKQDNELNQQRQLLTSIPGVGDLTAAVFLAEVGEIHHFPSRRALASYVGITPRLHDSGTSVHRHSRISKQGNKRLRTALYFPAISAKKWNPICHEFSQRLEKTGLAKKAIIIAVMKKLLHQMYGVLKSQQPFDPHFQQKPQIAA